MKFDASKPWPDGTRITFQDGTQATFERMDKTAKFSTMIVKFDGEENSRAFTASAWEKLHGQNIKEVTTPDGEVKARKAERDVTLAKKNAKFSKDCLKNAEKHVKDIENHLASGQGMLDFKAHE